MVCLIGKRIRVVIVVTIKFVGAAMKLVGARLRLDDNLPAATTPKGGVIVAAFQREFLDRVDARRIEQRAVRPTIVDVGAVHRPVVGPGSRAINRNLSIACSPNPGLSPNWFETPGCSNTNCSKFRLLTPAHGPGHQ